MDNLTIFSTLMTLLLGLYLYSRYRYTYWKRKRVPYLQPEFFYGNIRNMIKKQTSFAEQFKQVYEELKSRKVRHGGVFALFTPVYMPIDPEIIKCILQNDFKHFMNHGMYVNEESDPLTGHLFNLEGSKWAKMRTKLTPTFTSGKMKMMFPTFLACTEGLQAVLEDHQGLVNIKDITTRYTNDVIVSCAFGTDCDSLVNPDNHFCKFSQNIFNRSTIDRIKQLMVMLLPRSFLIKLNFKLTSNATESFFMKAINDIVKLRERSMVYRRDLMQLLLEMTGKLELTKNELIAQCFVFYLAGFETSATTMSFALYELAKHQDIQQKLRKEVESVLKRHGNVTTYEAVAEMIYLDQVLYETLRKYPPIPGTVRVCDEDYEVPGTNVVIETGTRVHIPIFGIHYDQEYYPDPEVFDPDRFTQENKEKRPAFTYLPFGGGPRICIGQRFGLLQSKVGLLTVIRHFRVTLDKENGTPLKLDKRAFILGAEGGVWLNISQIR